MALSKTVLIFANAVSWVDATVAFGSVATSGADTGVADVVVSAFAGGGASVLGIGAAEGASVAGLSATAT